MRENEPKSEQKRAARMILDKKFDHPSAPLLKHLEWLPFIQRCKYHTAILVFKSLNAMSPIYMKNILTTKESFYNLRSTNDIIHPLMKSRFTKNTFQYSAMNVWNDIPSDIKNTKKLCTFRVKYRNYLLQNVSQ